MQQTFPVQSMSGGRHPPRQLLISRWCSLIPPQALRAHTSAILSAATCTRRLPSLGATGGAKAMCDGCQDTSQHTEQPSDPTTTSTPHVRSPPEAWHRPVPSAGCCASLHHPFLRCTPVPRHQHAQRTGARAAVVSPRVRHAKRAAKLNPIEASPRPDAPALLQRPPCPPLLLGPCRECGLVTRNPQELLDFDPKSCGGT